MQAALAGGVFPGAVVLVRLRGCVLYHRAFGLVARTPVSQPASLRTIYDLASLTKPLATASAMVLLLQRGMVQLDTPLQNCLSELKGSQIGRVTVGDVLSHRSGLPAWRPYYLQICGELAELSPTRAQAQCRMLRWIREEPLEAGDGSRCRYSDLGYMLLGFLLERMTGRSLAALCREELYAPLGIDELFFMPVAGADPATHPDIDPARIAPTEVDPWRKRLVQGEVHDENAFALGGIAGHSGLFGTAFAVGQMSAAWLNARLDRDAPLSSTWVRKLVAGPPPAAGCSWVYGWDTPSGPSSSGRFFSASSFGHLGFTGTSLWIDPAIELEVVLLSNRVHPSRTNDGIRTFRPRIHDAIYQQFVRGGS
jgi:CubicO group peptidase (beta-lactamase class C family)